MSKHYSHLSYDERRLIALWLKLKLSVREISRRLDRCHSTISREVRRNYWLRQGYYCTGAQQMYQRRLARRAKRTRLKSLSIQKHVHDKLAIGWTPEIISGRLKETAPDRYVCHESIYQYIYIEAEHLVQYLPRKHKKRRAKRNYRSSGVRIKARTPLSLRPPMSGLNLAIGKATASSLAIETMASMSWWKESLG